MSRFEWNQITDVPTSVDALLASGVVTPERCCVDDLFTAAEWLATYDVDDDLELAQSLANVIGLLLRKVDDLERRERITEAKRTYAAEHGVPVSSLRVRR